MYTVKLTDYILTRTDYVLLCLTFIRGQSDGEDGDICFCESKMSGCMAVQSGGSLCCPHKAVTGPSILILKLLQILLNISIE